ncbi:hypothetical protein [Kineosporia babensis]|uniref:Uncharacterized protein n=1 Tax=Kineosporia babensis TaxID=499548 RepID=A0A9X1NLP4_9ACTN|nr:hypothetical protein [Kineosporia babensis]MCD5317267.1 hypothetical protein [Kineosporia babensis]
MSASAEQYPVPAPRPRRTIDELLAAKGTLPFASVEELSANAGIPDPELDEFLVTYRAERHQNQA